jgi:hypothetical protein
VRWGVYAAILLFFGFGGGNYPAGLCGRLLPGQETAAIAHVEALLFSIAASPGSPGSLQPDGASSLSFSFLSIEGNRDKPPSGITVTVRPRPDN